MRKFLFNISLFGLLIFGLLSISFTVCFQRSSKRISWTLESSKTVFITGDSYPECALNDSIISNSVNLSSSADTYIYSYVKIRKFIDHNPQIKTVLLGFSYHNLQARNDSFFKNTSPGISKFIRYFYLLENREIYEIFKANYNIIIKGLGSCYQKAVFFALTSIKDISYKQLNLGEYRSITKHLLNENLDQITKKKNLKPVQIKSSQIQIHFLEAIVRLCKNKGIRLILLNTPIHPEIRKTLKKEKAHFDQYCVKNQITNIIWDYSDFSLTDSCYADTEHLNYHGAENFSGMIRDELEKEEELFQ